MDMTEFHDLRHKVNLAATKIDAELGAARASNPPVDGNPHVQAAHAALGDLDKALIALDAWAKKQEAPPVEPPPPPQSGPGPVDPVPADGVLRNFGPMFQNTTYTTHAGGDGMFSYSTASGNSWYKMWVNGTLVIDGGMTPIGVKAGDKIDMQITTATQGNATYSLNKYGN